MNLPAGTIAGTHGAVTVVLVGDVGRLGDVEPVVLGSGRSGVPGGRGADVIEDLPVRLAWRGETWSEVIGRFYCLQIVCF